MTRLPKIIKNNEDKGRVRFELVPSFRKVNSRVIYTTFCFLI